VQDVVIVGAGISGLALAHYLQQNNIEHIVLERSQQTGGWIRTERSKDTWLEAGPHTVLLREEMSQLIEELSLEDKLLWAQASARYIAVDEEKLIPVPQSFFSALTTPLLSAWGKVRLLAEPFIPRTKASDLSVLEFLSRRIGRECTENVATTALRGVFAADFNTLSTRCALNRLWEQEQTYGSLLGGRLLGSSSNLKKGIFSLEGGLQTLTDTLAAQLNAEQLLTQAEVKALSPIDLGTFVDYQRTFEYSEATEVTSTEKICTKAVVLTGDALQVSSLIKPLDEALANKLAEIPYAPLGLLSVSYPRSAPSLDGFGFLVQSRVETPLLGAIFVTSLFPESFDSDRMLVTAFVGGSTHPAEADVRNTEVQQLVLQQLGRYLRTTAEAKIERARFFPRAIPNVAIGHAELQDDISQFQTKHPGIHFLANWSGGVGVPDRVREAKALSLELSETLTRKLA